METHASDRPADRSSALWRAAYRAVLAAISGGSRVAYAVVPHGSERGRSLRERLCLAGDPPARTAQPIWLHGASVGEVRSLRPLVDELRTRSAGPMILTTSTATGRAIGKDELELPCWLAPLDGRGPLQRFLSAQRPRMHVVVETEIWPQRIERLDALKIPVAMVSARVSDRSWPRYRRWRGLFGPAMARLRLLAAASERDRDRFVELGVRNEVLGPIGSLKWDTPLARANATRELDELGLAADRRWVVLGSVHPGEARTLATSLTALETFDAPLLIAPRHPRRFDEIAAELRQAGLAVHRLSDGPAADDARVVLLDRLGLLPSVYARAAVAVVGGTFVPVGGHSPLEAASSGCPIVCGPHIDQQRALIHPLEQAGGLVCVDDAEHAAEKIAAWLSDEPSRRESGQAALDAFRARRGIAARLAEAIVALERPR